MDKDIQVLIGGIQGEGVLATGAYYLQVLSRMGYHVYGKRHFTSRIKGGNSAMVAYGSVEKRGCGKDQMDIIMALDQDTVDIYLKDLRPGGLLLYDNAIDIQYNKNDAEKNEIQVIDLPITELVKEYGSKIMKNVCALGFLSRVTVIKPEIVEGVVETAFRKKGKKIIEENKKVLQAAVNYEFNSLKGVNYLLESVSEKDRGPVVVGNDLIGMGAVAAGCRFMAGYPITPASEIMQYLSTVLPRFKGRVIQTEDEISAINMIIGSSYAGVRSMTATSGPGISLMIEGLGLSSMAEVPIVVVDAQRKGPSTGLPTKLEQSDLNTLYYGGHGEFPLIILAPATFEDCFYDTVEAFNLADIYQCPVIILSDSLRSLSYENIDSIDFDRIRLNRGKIVQEIDQNQNDDTEPFKRYGNLEDGISKRVFPGTANGLHHVTGLEHDEKGYPIGVKASGEGLTEKRMNKLIPLEERDGIILKTNEGNKILFLAYGSTFSYVERAVKNLDGIVDYGGVKQIKPLPKKQLRQLMNDYEKIVVVENNYSGQLRKIIQAELGNHNQLESLLDFSGEGFKIEKIESKIKEVT